MALIARTSHRVPFHDVDVMRISWHGHYLKYFEIGRTALMQSLGLDWPVLEQANIAMPVVEAHAQYRRPVKYDDLLTIEARLEDFQFAEMVIHYKIFAGAGTADEILCSTGWTRQVYVNGQDQSIFFVLPEFVREKLNAAVKERS